MSSDSLGIGKIPLLSSQAQYQDWALEVTATAMMGGFHGPFVGDNSSQGKDDEIDKFHQREMKARGLILKTVSLPLKKGITRISSQIGEI